MLHFMVTLACLICFLGGVRCGYVFGRRNGERRALVLKRLAQVRRVS